MVEIMILCDTIKSSGNFIVLNENLEVNNNFKKNHFRMGANYVFEDCL
jgi:hypothetical protein